MNNESGTQFRTYAHTLLRIFAGAGYFSHGAQKFLGWFGGFGDAGKAELMSRWGAAGVIETICGACIVLGLFTRPVAFILAGEMAVAYFQFHQPQAFWPTVNGGGLAVLYCFIWLYFSAAGPGPWSLDESRRS